MSPRASTSSSRASLHRSLAGFLPPVARWFFRSFDRPTPAQVKAWPPIRRGENVLLLAPTGSGKTLAAFLCAIDGLFRQAADKGLPDGVQVLYITPLKALGNDIQKNLLDPLEGIRKASRGRLPELRISVRTGDTSQAERAEMVRKPPHILITTPESLYLLLGSPRMLRHLRNVRTVIVDEVHALCGSKRGVHLAVSLERLQAITSTAPQRVGCSATLSPLDAISSFLVGRDSTGAQRPCRIVDAGARKNLDVSVSAPLPDFLEATNAALWASAYEILVREISGHDTTLVFCNTRQKAERTALHLGELGGDGTRVGVHHGSMSRELRLEAEDDLKSGRLSALVATASLELGIDIGSIDLVYQLESPKSVATGLQRIGRAGHLLDRTSKGRVLVFDPDELLEAAAVCRGMLDGKVDDIRLPRGCLDVLAQQIAGVVAVEDWQTDDLLALIRRSYPYWDLSRDQFESTLEMLSGSFPFTMDMPPRPVILWDRAAGRISPTRSTQHVSAMCVGTIPESAEYEVVIEGSRKRAGSVPSDFVEDRIRAGDVFVLGSTSWRLVGIHRTRLIVREAPGETPTVPRWHGTGEPRTPEVGRGIGRLRRVISSNLNDPALGRRLQKDYRLSATAAEAAIDYVRRQHMGAGLVPDHEQLLVETWQDELGRWHMMLHSPFGKRINQAWGAALAAAAGARGGRRPSATVTNDLVLLTDGEGAEPGPLEDPEALFGAITEETVELLVADAAHADASFGGTFRNVAVCGLQVLRAYKGKRVPLWLQNLRSDDLLEVAGGEADYPVVREVMRSYLEDALDLTGLKAILRDLADGSTRLVFQDVDYPSPFCHALLLGDVRRSRGRPARQQRAQLLRLHRRVLQQVLREEQLAELLDGRAIEQLEGRKRHTAPTTRAATPDELAAVIRELGDLPATVETLREHVHGDPVDMLRSLVADRRIVAIELPDDDVNPVRLVSVDQWREYHDAYAWEAPEDS